MALLRGLARTTGSLGPTYLTVLQADPGFFTWQSEFQEQQKDKSNVQACCESLLMSHLLTSIGPTGKPSISEGG